MAEKKNHKMQSEKQFKGQFKMQPSKVLKRSFIAKSLIYLKQQYGVRVRKLPISMIHYVTDKCNAKCEHCFYWKSLGGKYEPSLEEIEKLVKGMPKLNSVSLTGGEPFLREDIVDVALIWAKKADRISIPTNGLLTERIVKDVREILDKTKDMGTSVSVQVSLDGLKRLHDKTRGVKIFDKAVKTLKELR